jgi:ABC-type nitrate/sulfonate/bicarbonate transport system substrate-binding protein
MKSQARLLILPLALVLAGTFYLGLVNAQERLRIAWAGGASSAPIWIVQEKGLMKRQGVNAEIIRVSASTMALQAMLAGELDVIGTSVTTLVTSRLAGADVIMILAIVPTFPAHIVTSKSVTDVKQLKGKVGGVGRPGTTTEIGMRLALGRLGLDPNVDVKLVPVGSTADALAALSKGVVQFSILVEPFVREAEKFGYKSLIDIGSLNIPFHWNGVLTGQANVQSKGPLIAKFARAMVEAIHIYKTDKESTLKIISKYTQITNPDSLDRTYQTYIKILPEVPLPAPEGVKTFLDYMAPSRPEAAKANPRDFVDLSFVQEVQTSGFIRQLYGR